MFKKLYRPVAGISKQIKLGPSVLTPYYTLTPYKKSEKYLEPFSSKLEITLLLGRFWPEEPPKYQICTSFGKKHIFPGKNGPVHFLRRSILHNVCAFQPAAPLLDPTPREFVTSSGGYRVSQFRRLILD